MAKVRGHRFDAFDRPIRHFARDDNDGEAVLEEHTSIEAGSKGKFF
jgi:hypothetical protein